MPVPSTPANASSLVPSLVLVLGLTSVLGGQESTGQVTSAQEPASVVLIDPVRIEQAHRRLAQASATFDDQVPLSRLFSVLLVPETEGQGTSRVADHRAALLVAAFFVNQWPVQVLVPEAGSWPRPTPRRVTLGGRRDHAQHFSLSAAMAAVVGTPLADMMAVFKEMRDARGGTGFSFSDMLANRAGQRFGALAAESAATAERVTLRMRIPLSDSDIMPAPTGLPDGLTEQEFTRRFGAVGSGLYNELVATIEARIGGLALYR